MPIYYFGLHTGNNVIADEEGSQLPDLQAARVQAVAAARELLAHAIHQGREAPDSVKVIDETGEEVLAVSLIEVLPASLRKQLR